DDMGDPFWSPNGRNITVVWSTGQASHRVIVLSWAHADGSDRQDLVDRFWDVRDLLWFRGGQSLAFITQRADGYGVDTVDLDTGVHRRLVGGMAQILNITRSQDNTQISFWWRAPDGSAGVSGFDSSTQPLYQFAGRGPDQPLLTAGLFWSPDRRLAVL